MRPKVPCAELCRSRANPHGSKARLGARYRSRYCPRIDKHDSESSASEVPRPDVRLGDVTGGARAIHTLAKAVQRFDCLLRFVELPLLSLVSSAAFGQRQGVIDAINGNAHAHHRPALLHLEHSGSWGIDFESQVIRHRRTTTCPRGVGRDARDCFVQDNVCLAIVRVQGQARPFAGNILVEFAPRCAELPLLVGAAITSRGARWGIAATTSQGTTGNTDALLPKTILV
jgi:hypothetical protein